MDPIAYRFAVTQHDGMRLTYEGTTSVACKLNIWEGTELVPPHLHTKYSTDRRHEAPARSASDVFGKTVSSETYRVCLRCLTEQ